MSRLDLASSRRLVGHMTNFPRHVIPVKIDHSCRVSKTSAKGIPRMLYVPVFCVSCARCSLSAAKDGRHALLCAFCEWPARAVPGPAYGDGDWLAFAEIDRAVFDAGLSAVEALSLASELQAMLENGVSFVQTTERLVARVPSLSSARPALVSQPTRGLRMLATTLSARTREESTLSQSAPNSAAPPRSRSE